MESGRPFESPLVLIPMVVGVTGGTFVTGFLVGDVPLYLLPYALIVAGAGFLGAGITALVLHLRRGKPPIR